MNLLTLLLSIVVAILTSYLAYHHQTPLYLLTAFCAVMVALILLLAQSGIYRQP